MGPGQPDVAGVPCHAGQAQNDPPVHQAEQSHGGLGRAYEKGCKEKAGATSGAIRPAMWFGP